MTPSRINYCFGGCLIGEIGGTLPLKKKKILQVNIHLSVMIDFFFPMFFFSSPLIMVIQPQVHSDQ